MKRLRRTILELWAMLPLAAVAGFLGPFGTYLSGDFVHRTGRWGVLLLGAYILVRPTMILWSWLARATALPHGTIVFCGLMLSSFPMALVWQWAGMEEVRPLGGYAGLLPFTALCAALIMVVAAWADRADAHLLRFYDGTRGRRMMPDAHAAIPVASDERPRLYARLSARFTGDIIALESEDHYVRVHGRDQSELLLIRLRDAIAEMDRTPGEQTHRSWWVARDAVTGTNGSGRSRDIMLPGGLRVPVARDSVERLTQSGFLPG